MQWDSNDHTKWQVVEYSGWLNLENYTELQDRSGVYIFANSELQVKYVGKAGARRMVQEIANAISREKDYGATKVKALYTNSDANALSLESDLINKYDPHNNH